MRIDSHHHLWDLKKVHYPWLMERGKRRFFGDPTPIQRDFLVGEFREIARASGVSASVHVQVGASDALQEARWVQSVADDNPGWPVAQVAFCDLAVDDVEASLAPLLELSTTRGIRQIVGRSSAEDSRTGTNQLLDDPRFEAGLNRVAELGLSFDLQLTPGLMQKTAELLSRIERLPVALCHCGSPDDWTAEGVQKWKDLLRLLAELPRMHCKLSGLGMFRRDWSADHIRPIAEVCLELFGPDRCMFGSNFPVDSLSSSYDAIVSAYLEIVPECDHAKVFSGTAKRFYRIDI